jgi:hypothetical protein
MVARYLDIGVGQLPLGQISQKFLSLRVPPGAMLKKRAIIKRGRFSRAASQALLDLRHGFLQTSLAFQPGGQTQSCVRRTWVRFNRALVTCARAINLAQPVVLLAEHDQDIRVGGGQRLRTLEGLAGQREIQIARRRRAELEPKIDDARKSPRQITINRERNGSPARQQMLLRLAPAFNIARRLFQSGKVRLLRCFHQA